MTNILYIYHIICKKCPYSKNYQIGINCTYDSEYQFDLEDCPRALKIIDLGYDYGKKIISEEEWEKKVYRGEIK